MCRAGLEPAPERPLAASSKVDSGGALQQVRCRACHTSGDAATRCFGRRRRAGRPPDALDRPLGPRADSRQAGLLREGPRSQGPAAAARRTGQRTRERRMVRHACSCEVRRGRVGPRPLSLGTTDAAFVGRNVSPACKRHRGAALRALNPRVALHSSLVCCSLPQVWGTRWCVLETREESQARQLCPLSTREWGAGSHVRAPLLPVGVEGITPTHGLDSAPMGWSPRVLAVRVLAQRGARVLVDHALQVDLHCLDPRHLH